MATSSSWYKSKAWTAADEGNEVSGYSGNHTGGVSGKADKILKAYRHSVDAFADSRADSEKAMRYVNNDSWDKTDLSKAKKHSKPTLKYNIIMPILSTLMGNEQLSRKRPKFIPRTIESVDLVDTIQGRWNAINDEQDFEEKLQGVFLDALIFKTGGWIERNFEVNDDGYLDFVYKIANGMRVYVDSETKTNDYTLTHCRWIIKEGWESLDVIEEKYGKAFAKLGDLAESEKKSGWWNQLAMFFRRFKDSDYSKGSLNDYDRENDRYKILEMQERVFKKMVTVFDGTEYFNITAGEFRKLKTENESVQKIREFEKGGIHVTTLVPYFNNVIIMDEEAGGKVANFDIFPMFSYGLSTQVNETTSLVDLLMDVQDDVNKGKSQVRDYVTQILSGGIFISRQEKDVIKQLQQRGNMPNQVYPLKDPINKPHTMPPGQIPPDIMLNTENSVQYAQRISLVNEAMKGESGRSGESGVLFQKKVERAAAAINPYYKNLSNLRKTIAKDFVDNFAYVYSEYDRVIKVKGEGGMFRDEYLNLAWNGQILNNVNNASVFVELDEGDDNVTAKEENFEKMLALINIISQVNPQFVDVKTLIEIAPIKGVDKMIEYIDNTIQQQSEMGDQTRQLDETKQLLENAKIERGMINDEEKLRLEGAKLNKERANA